MNVGTNNEYKVLNHSVCGKNVRILLNGTEEIMFSGKDIVEALGIKTTDAGYGVISRYCHEWRVLTDDKIQKYGLRVSKLRIISSDDVIKLAKGYCAPNRDIVCAWINEAMKTIKGPKIIDKPSKACEIEDESFDIEAEISKALSKLQDSKKTSIDEPKISENVSTDEPPISKKVSADETQISEKISTDIIPFFYNESEIRTIRDEDGGPWFVAKDVCDVLGIVNGPQAVGRLDDDEKAAICLTDISSNGTEQQRNFTTINEPGLYNLIIRSDKPEAKLFKRWITRDVLPAIRKTGSYAVHNIQANVDSYVVKRLSEIITDKFGKIRNIVESMEKKYIEQNAVIKRLEDKLEAISAESNNRKNLINSIDAAILELNMKKYELLYKV